MAKIIDQLEQLFAKVRALPEERQELAVEALAEIADPDVYVLSAEERAILEPALTRARNGEFAPDGDVDAAIGKPWT